MQYICISMSAGMLLVMFIFHDLVGSFFLFFYFSFLRKKSSFFCYPSVGWQCWALIKKNYSWSCSCYPLCEIINDFIDSWWWHIFSSFCLWPDLIFWSLKNCFVTCRDKADKSFCDNLRLCMRVCVYVQHACQCVWERDDRRVCCTVGAECQMVSVNEYYPTMCSLFEVKREGILSLDYATASLTQSHLVTLSHTYLHALTLVLVH